jgi:hypothetical protein
MNEQLRPECATSCEAEQRPAVRSQPLAAARPYGSP